MSSEKASLETLSQTSKPLPSCVSEELEPLRSHQVHEAASLLVDAFLNDSKNEDPSPLYAWVLEDLLLDDQRAEPPRFREQRQRQRDALHWLFCKNLDAYIEHDVTAKRKPACRCVFLREPDRLPKMICFFILSSHETKTNDSSNCFGAVNCSSNTDGKISWLTMIRHGILWFPVLFGWKSFYRLIISDDFYNSLNENYLSSQGDLGSHHFSVKTGGVEVPENNVRNRSSNSSLSYRLLERMVVHPSMHGKGIGSYFLQKALFSEEQNHDTDVTAAISDGSNNDGLCLLQTDKERTVGFYSRLGFTIVKRCDFETRRFAPDTTTWLMVLSPSEPKVVSSASSDFP